MSVERFQFNKGRKGALSFGPDHKCQIIMLPQAVERNQQQQLRYHYRHLKA